MLIKFYRFSKLCVVILPGSIELHLDSTVQRRAAELKLQHKVNLQTKKRIVCWSDAFYLEGVKHEWAESSEWWSFLIVKDVPLTGSEILDSWRYMSGCWHQVLCTRS